MLMKKTVLLLCVLMLLVSTAGASAEGCFLLKVDALDMTRLNQDAYVQQYLSAQTQGLRVQKQIPEGLSQPVRLSLVQMPAQTLVFDKDYGYQTGLFDSGDIYLPFLGNQTVPYLVTLYVGDMVYAMPFMHLQSRLYGNGACTYGAYLYDYNSALARDWHMGTMLDLNALRQQGYMAVDVCASNCYLVGHADVFWQNDAICVAVNFLPSANVELTEVALYVNTDCAGLTSPTQGGPYQLGDWIPVGDADSALLYLPMTINYDPAGLSVYSYQLGSGYLQRQTELWWENLNGGQAETEWTAGGEVLPETGWPEWSEETEPQWQEPAAEESWEETFAEPVEEFAPETGNEAVEEMLMNDF